MLSGEHEPADEAPWLPPIDIQVNDRELPADVALLRERSRVDDAANEKVAQPRIEANVAACRLVATQLQRWHQGIADHTDLDLTGYSRPAAIWLLAGRCLGLLEALLVQVEAGIDNEIAITGRAIHEAARVLMVFSQSGEDELVRIWLDDEGKHGYVKPGAAREAQGRFQDQVNEAMQREGLKPVGNTTELSADMYDRLSRIAHARRSSCVNSVWESGRQMAYGRHPSPLRRASTAEWGVTMTVEVVNAVGDALAGFYAQGFFTDEIAPLIQSVEAVRLTAPLDEASIRQAAGTD